MILTCAQMKAAEEMAFASGVQAEDLMEAAGAAIASQIEEVFPQHGICHTFFGKGNNGGDALVAARLLASRGWIVVEHPSSGEDDLGSLVIKKLAALRQIPAPPPASALEPMASVVLDGLLGIGARGAPSGEVARRIREIHRLRERGAWVVAIDLPSGLECDTGVPHDPCVCADLTVTLGFAKSGLLADEAIEVVGRLVVVPLEGVSCQGGDPWELGTAECLSPLLPRRPFDTHKGLCGRVGLVAGSPGFTGAARLCSAAAVRAGAGLVTLFADPAIWPILSGSCLPEVMVRKTQDLRECLETPLDVLAIGPGLGRSRDREVLALIRDFPGPCVVDADALNALSGDPGLLKKARGPRLLTPHPGEMERLSPRRGRTRRAWATEFAMEHGCHIVLKGARSLTVDPCGRGAFNTTGTPGMASGGMGDVLTGVSAALCHQVHNDLAAAAKLGMWLCGCASEIALRKGQSQESLIASDTITYLGQAFHALRLPSRSTAF